MNRCFLAIFSVIICLVNCYGRVCRSAEHVIGEWRRKQEDSKSFFCCENNGPVPGARCAQVEDYRYHSGSCELFTPEYSGGCSCDQHQGQFDVHLRERYQWYPRYCSLIPWNASNFCEVLGNRRILLVGDSTMHQTATTLMSMLTSNDSNITQAVSEKFLSPGGVGSGCATQVYFGLARMLVWRSGEDISLLRYIKKFNPLANDIVIVTAGAHMQDIGDAESMWETLSRDIRTIRRDHPRIQIAWKTSNPGHVSRRLFKRTSIA